MAEISTAAPDPLVAAFFAVEMQGKVKGVFRELGGMGSETEVTEHQASDSKGAQVVKMVPGRLKWTPISLKQGITTDKSFWEWRTDVEIGDMDKARKNGSLVMFDTQGKEAARWDFVNAWPSKITGPQANATQSSIAIEEMTIVHEGVKRVK
jgi:phage tail-like protein